MRDIKMIVETYQKAKTILEHKRIQKCLSSGEYAVLRIALADIYDFLDTQTMAKERNMITEEDVSYWLNADIDEIIDMS